jgi:hypothetical protein
MVRLLSRLLDLSQVGLGDPFPSASLDFGGVRISDSLNAKESYGKLIFSHIHLIYVVVGTS